MDSVEEQQNKRSLAAEQAEDKKKKSLKDKLTDASNKTEAAKKIQENLKKIKKVRQGIRAINIASALSVVGLIVTWLIMSLQLIIGNLLDVKEIALEDAEIVIWAVMSFILLALLIIIIIVVGVATDPWSTAVGTMEDIGNWLSGN